MHIRKRGLKVRCRVILTNNVYSMSYAPFYHSLTPRTSSKTSVSQRYCCLSAHDHRYSWSQTALPSTTFELFSTSIPPLIAISPHNHILDTFPQHTSSLPLTICRSLLPVSFCSCLYWYHSHFSLAFLLLSQPCVCVYLCAYRWVDEVIQRLEPEEVQHCLLLTTWRGKEILKVIASRQR